MRPIEVVIIVISLVLIILAIIFGRALIDKHYSYGQWQVSTTPCENEGDDCSAPAFQFTDRNCIPDARTRRGCINENGVQVYAPEITSVSCNLQCRKSKWEIDVGPCDSNTGKQKVTYTCRSHDTTGINACTIGGLVDFVDGQYQNVTVYNVGQMLEWDIRCLIPDASPKVLEPAAPSEIYVPPTAKDYSYYMLGSACYAEEEIMSLIGPTTTLAPLAEGMTLSGHYCRRWPRDGLVFMLKTPQGVVIPFQTPNDNPAMARFRHWGKSMERHLYDTPLTWLPPHYLKNACSAEEVTFATGVMFMLAPRGESEEKDHLLCKVAVVIDNHYWGWLKVEKGKVFWTQACTKPGSPGLTSHEAQLFEVEFDTNNQIEIRTHQGLAVYLSDAVSLARDRKTTSLKGEMLLVETDRDFYPRTDLAAGNCNFLHT